MTSGTTIRLRERVQMALAEAGYPNAEVTGTDEDPSVNLSGPNGVPGRVCWKAFKVAGYPNGCYPCWDEGYLCTETNRSDRCAGRGG